MSVTLTPGRYPLPDAFHPNDVISSLKPTTASIKMYQHVHFGGREVFASQPIPDVGAIGYSDVVSSCKIPPGSTWMLYEHISYKGDVSILGPGDYPNPKSMNLPNDILSSLRPFPIVTGPAVLLFQDSKFGGRMVVATGAISDFTAINFNDKVSSFIVLSGNWTAYRDINFHGDPTQLTQGHFPEPTFYQNDSISSIKPDL